MTTRKRNDDRGYDRGAMGIDGKEGSNYTEAYNVYDRQGRRYPGQRSKESSYPGEYGTNDAGLKNVDDFQYTAGTRQIWQDVEENQNPRGDSGGYGFDATGAVKAGVSRSQKDGDKKGGAR